MKMKAKLFEYLRDEKGQTSTEYILLVAVVTSIVFRFKGLMIDKLTKIMDMVFSDDNFSDLTKH